MKKAKRYSVWVTGMALGIGSAALLPATPAFAQAPGGAVPQAVDNADVPKAVKDAFHDRFKQGTNAKYLRLTQGGATYYVVLFNRGEGGARAEAIISDAGQLLEGPIPARPADAPRTVGQAGVGGAPLPRANPAGQNLDQLTTYRVTLEAERQELQREQQRAQDALAKLRQDTSRLSDAERRQFMTEVASIEEQAASRAQQALERAQRAEQDLAAFRQQLQNQGTPAADRERLTELERLAAERLTVNREIMRAAQSYQVAMDEFDMPGAAQPAAGRGVTRDQIEARDLPAAVRDALERQTKGGRVSGYYRLVNNGRNYYSAHYEAGGKRYFVRVNDQGQIVRGPQLADGAGEARPAAARDLGDRVAGEDLPREVRRAVDTRLSGSNHYFYRNGNEYRVIYKAADGNWMSARVNRDGDVTAAPERIERPPADVRDEADFRKPR